jgi:hypothetical protein
MPTIAYLANLFPSPVEPYVADEIQELRRRDLAVIPCSARQAGTGIDPNLKTFADETLYLQPLRLKLAICAALAVHPEIPYTQRFLSSCAAAGKRAP